MNSQEVVKFWGCHLFVSNKDFLCAHAQTPMEWVLCFLAHSHSYFGEYTNTFELHRWIYISVVDMIVNDMQVWCGCVLFELPMKCMTSWPMFAIVCMDMVDFLLKMNVDSIICVCMGNISNGRVQTNRSF